MCFVGSMGIEILSLSPLSFPPFSVAAMALLFAVRRTHVPRPTTPPPANIGSFCLFRQCCPFSDQCQQTNWEAMDGENNCIHQASHCPLPDVAIPVHPSVIQLPIEARWECRDHLDGQGCLLSDLMKQSSSSDQPTRSLHVKKSSSLQYRASLGS